MFGCGVAKIEKGKRKYRAITKELNTCKDTHIVALNAPLLCSKISPSQIRNQEAPILSRIL